MAQTTIEWTQMTWNPVTGCSKVSAGCKYCYAEVMSKRLGESGPKVRPMKAEWVSEIKDQCRAAGTAFFFKQWGGRNKKKTGRVLEGRVWDEVPLRGNNFHLKSKYS
jgi:protein gp37